MKILIIVTMFVTSQSVFPDENYIPGGENHWWFLGAELGSQDKTDIQAPEVENNGFQVGIKGVYSHYWTDFVADVGLGYRYDEMDDGVEVDTKAFFLELGARYRLSNRWSLGPQVQMLLGKDVSFSDVGTNSDDKSSALFLGGRIFYDFSEPEDDFMFRMGAQALTDMNIDDRKVTYLQVVAEIGWPFGSADEAVVTEKEETAPPKKQVEKIRLSLKQLGIKFKTGSSELDGKSEEILNEIASILVENSRDWTRIKISGHTDSTGGYEMNMNLSKERARSVRDVFIKNSISGKRIRAVGYGPNKPIDKAKTKEAYAINRRVELQIYGKNAGKEFLRQLNIIIKKYSRI